MADTLEYILSLKDGMSSKLKSIGIHSDQALNKFSKLQKQANDVDKSVKTFGGSIGSLREKLHLLQQEKEWIPASNIRDIRTYNSEIEKTTKAIARLEGGGKSKFRTYTSQLFESIPMAGALTNPITLAGGAMYKTTSMAMDFDAAMAKINTTAQLSPPKLEALKKKLQSIDPSLVSDWAAIPESYESIISMNGDVGKSYDILKASLIGAKAAQADQTVVAKALAQTQSLTGGKAKASEILDTFLAAKRVGAGEFEDFANYMPNLIASGDALGLKYKEVAGVFAYMTGKGQSAERSSVLMENAFSAMGKMDVRKNLAGAGINVFDEKGSVRSMTDIFTDLNKKMKGMSDEQKSSFLAKMGLTDKEARSAFIVLSGDVDKLKSSINEVSKADGEASNTMKFSMNDKQRVAELFSQIQLAAIKVGSVLSTVLVPVFQVLTWTVSTVADTLGWLFDGFRDGNPWVYAAAVAVTAYTVATKGAAWWTAIQNKWLDVLILKEKFSTYWTKIKTVATYALTGATWLYETAVIAVNAAWAASPIGMIILGVVALGAAVYGVTKLFNQQSAAEKVNGEVKARALEKTIEQRAELNVLFDRLRAAKKGTEEYTNALAELEKQAPGIVDKYNLQAGAIDNINRAQRDLIANIDAVAQAEARKELVKEKYKEKINNQNRGNSTFESFVEATGGVNYGRNIRAIDNAKLAKEISVLEKQIAKDDAKTAKAERKKQQVGEKTGINQTNAKLKQITSDALDTEQEINDRIKELNDLKATQTIGSKDYKASEHEIASLEARLGKRGGAGSAASTGAKTNEAIATGGTKQTTININFRDLVHQMTVAGSDFKEATINMEQQVGDTLLRLLNMATSTAG